MARRNCSTCGRAWPDDVKKCPFDSTPTTYEYSGKPDTDASLARLDELIPAVDAAVVVNGNELTVSSWAVFRAFKRRLRPEDLIRVGKQVFEVLKYDHEARHYRVRSFGTELTDEDLGRLTG